MPTQRLELPRLWRRLALGAVLLVSIFMNFFQLGLNGYGNLYYAAGVRSMADSWHNFFFVSFDPGGFVTIDKPPLGFWLQTISTHVFGFTPFSIFLPQALCGVLAVLLLYHLVRRHFGVVAGLIAALALAVSPISVVTNRNNTIDGTLALVLLLAAWAIILACESGKLRWLLLSAVWVGIGFNVKMAEAYLVVPALVMAYLLCAPRKLWTRIWHLSLFVVVALTLSLSWAIVVDLTPAAQRPYVGSTQDNSELSLAFGYNGLNRLRIGGNRFGRYQSNTRTTTKNTPDNTSNSTNTPAPGNGSTSGNNAGGQFPTARGGNPTGAAQGPGGAFQNGAFDPLRLFSTSLGGQIAWLLPFALLAIVALAWWRRPRLQQDRQQLGLVLWGFWLITMAVFFTLEGAFHEYYMTEMAPGLCALVGIGLVVMWQQYRSGDWRGWLLPFALALTAVVQIAMLSSYPTWAQWLSPLIAILTVLALLALLFFRLGPRFNVRAGLATVRVASVALSIGMLALLVAPTVWSGYSVIQNTESSAPTAGPGAQGNPGGARTGFAAGNGRGQGNFNNQQAGAFAGFFGGESSRVDPALISYLETNQGNAQFLVATPSSNMADGIILATNKPVMAMGGFSGSDPILTNSDLQNVIANGTVRFFLLNSPRATQRLFDQLPEQYRERFGGRFGGGGFGFGGQAQSALSTWISNHCSAVPSNEWQGTTRSTSSGQLYDCATARSA